MTLLTLRGMFAHAGGTEDLDAAGIWTFIEGQLATFAAATAS